jgi:hypothetical protein
MNPALVEAEKNIKNVAVNKALRAIDTRSKKNLRINPMLRYD